MLGGSTSNATMPGFKGNPTATSYLLQYGMATRDCKNRTGPNNVQKAEGTLRYLPIGNAGALVYSGGGFVNSTSGEFDESPSISLHRGSFPTREDGRTVSTMGGGNRGGSVGTVASANLGPRPDL